LRGAALQAKLATIIFLLAALSNNTLSSKTPEMTMIVVLLLAYGAPAGQRRHEGSRVPTLAVRA
jgi:hypothetical protein